MAYTEDPERTEFEGMNARELLVDNNGSHESMTPEEAEDIVKYLNSHNSNLICNFAGGHIKQGNKDSTLLTFSVSKSGEEILMHCDERQINIQSLSRLSKKEIETKLALHKIKEILKLP